MRIDVNDAALGEGIAAVVPPMSFSVGPGAPVVIAVETDERPQMLSLMLAGRLQPDAGVVLADGVGDPAALRAEVALIDTPFTAEPNPGIALRTIVAEELAFAERPAGRRAVADLLAARGLDEWAKQPIRALPTAPRIRLLCDLALLRSGITTLVVTSPQRHGGEPAAWFGEVLSIAESGVTVVVITDVPTARALYALGGIDSTPELEPVPTDLENVS